jgi:oxaloacetate decarboxylase gamma subunit
MPVTDMLFEGLRLMVIGMGIVFAFLLLLVAILRLMSEVASRLLPETPVEAQSAPTVNVGHAGPEQDGELLAVISAAIARYRKDRRNT